MGLQQITVAGEPPRVQLMETVYRLPREERADRPAVSPARWQFSELGSGAGTAIGGETAQWHHVSVTQANAEPLEVAGRPLSVYTGFELSGVPSGFTAILDSTGVELRSDEMSALSQAAEMEDTPRFVSLAEQIDWFDQTPGDFVAAIHWALQLGAHGTARILAEKGHGRYPDQVEITRLQRLTAPPRALPEMAYPHSSVRKNKIWLEERGEAYQGLWVALDAGDLIACAETVSELKDRMGKLKGYLVTKVR